MNKSNYIHFRLSDEELRKLDIACEFHECNRTEFIRKMINVGYSRVVRKEKGKRDGKVSEGA